MQQILISDQVKIVAGLLEVCFALVCLGIILVMLLHTLSFLGRKTIRYTKYPQAKGWNKRFYPAASGMVILLLALMWILNVWRHSSSS